MAASSRAPQNLAPLLHLLAGAVLGAGLVGIALLGARPTTDSLSSFTRCVRFLADWGLVGVVGGVLGGVAVALRPDRGAYVPGLRFWMLSLGAGGALTFGAVALRDASARPSGAGGGPAVYVLTWLVVGWLTGLLLGAVGAAFARAASSAATAALRRTTAKVVGAVLGGAAWAVFWGVLVALLALLGLGVVLLSLRAGGDVPALAVGGACGAVFFAVRYVFVARGPADSSVTG
jgi:hypothetical protein